jgi:hypothetical protein
MSYQNNISVKDTYDTLSWFDMYEKPTVMMGMLGLKNIGSYYDQEDVMD